MKQTLLSIFNFKIPIPSDANPRVLLAVFLAVVLCVGITVREWAARVRVEKLELRIQALIKGLDSLTGRLAAQESSSNRLDYYSEKNARLEGPSAKETRLVFFGDSIMKDWPVAKTFKNASFRPLNRGVAGQETRRLLARLYQDVVLLRPRAVIILGGTNDLELGIVREMTKLNLREMVELCRWRGIPVLLGTLPPIGAAMPLGGAHLNDSAHSGIDHAAEKSRNILAINKWIRAYCRSGACSTLDFHNILTRSDGSFNPDLFSDTVHPNDAGYAAMTALVRKTISDSKKISGLLGEK